MTNPLVSFSVETFLEKNKQKIIEKHKRLVLAQAEQIFTSLTNIDTSIDKLIVITSSPRSAGLYKENKEHLCANGFRVWQISEVRQEYIHLVTVITWDCVDFEPIYQDHVAWDKKNGQHIVKSSYKEL